MKGNRLYSVFLCKCPRCHEGDLFTHGVSYNFKKMEEMNEHCPHCGLTITPEVGYYYGAMYASYAFALIESALLAVLTYGLLKGIPTLPFLGGLMVALALMTPFNFRWGRALWINIFHSYERKYAIRN